MEQYQERCEVKAAKVEEYIKENMSRYAASLIEKRPENEKFLLNPDAVDEHSPEWHQFGIVTHVEKTNKAFREKIPAYLEKWGLEDEVEKIFNEKIDGMTKEELFGIALLVHDLGKFRRILVEKNGQVKFSFKDHEKESSNIILENEEINSDLKKQGLTDKQIAYIAKCADLHFELGKMREEAKKYNLGYSINFVDNERCQTKCLELAEENSELRMEVGLLFLCDSLAKTDIVIDAKTDQEIEEKSNEAKRKITSLGLDDKLISAVKQMPVNIAIAKKYLELVKQHENFGE